MFRNNGEEFCVEKFRQMIFGNHILPDGTDTGVPRIEYLWGQAGIKAVVPVDATGFTNEVTVLPRDDAAKISIWCDSVQTVDPTATSDYPSSGTLGHFYENVVIVVMYTFSARQEDIGTTKRLAGQVIRDIIYNAIRSYIPSAHYFRVNADYRFGSDRMQGGSRRGFRGNLKTPGHMKESLLVAASFNLKRDVPVLFC